MSTKTVEQELDLGENGREKGAGKNVEHLVEGTRKAKEVLRNDIKKKR